MVKKKENGFYNEDGSVFSRVMYKNGYPEITDDMVKKETEMLRTYSKMKGKIEEPSEANISRE